MEQKLIKREPLGSGFYAYVTPEHTFGTDAVLLSHFAAAKKRDRLVDLGTGCGIIPLLMLRDGSLQSAVGVDISPDAISLAQKAGRELVPEKLLFIESDLKDLKGKLQNGCHTLVTCNPPYKAPNAGLLSENMRARVARHETACRLEDIISVSAKLLETGGRLCICHRPERLSELMRLMSEYKIEPKRLRLVCKDRGSEPWLVLVEGKKCANIGLRIAPCLFVEENGRLTDEMIEIYGAYKEAYL